MRLVRLSFVFFLSALLANASLEDDVLQYGKLSNAEQAAVIAQLKGGWRGLPEKQRKLVQEACVERSGQITGRERSDKLKAVKDEGDKLILKIAGEYLNSLPPEEVPAHPSAEELFGKIPKNAKRISQTVEIDPSIVRWHSTGLYAAPGEVVELVFPSAGIDQGFSVIVSGHRDRIKADKRDVFLRTPAPVSRRFPINRRKVIVAGAYGGAIYIDTGKQPIDRKPFRVKISNALQAPYFVLGKTDVKEWRSKLRKAPGPYAEFVSDRVAFSFPSEWIRDLRDPTELMEYWNRVVELHDELGGMAHTRNGPERVNVDVQISVGLFHSGYPMQGPQKQCRGLEDVDQLKTRGNWGWFHEMGHEAQRRPDKAWGCNNPYTFDNSVEVTVNLFSTHGMDRIGMDNRGGWSWTASPEAVAQKARSATTGGKKYPEMDFGEKLSMFLQLRDGFGWESIQTALTSYTLDQDKNPSDLPKDNQAKRDEFLIRMSKAVEHNLTPFLQDLWGIPMSKDAVRKIEKLPVWLPEGFGQGRGDLAQNDRKRSVR